MLGSINMVLFLLCLPLLFSTFSESCSDGTTQPLISGSRYRVQDQFFETDSVIGIYTPEQARLEGNSWCSLRAPSEPWLQVTFGMDINISIIQTGGIDNYYVTRFEVHVGDNTEGSLHPLTRSDDSTQPMVFVRTRGYNVENTTLPSPVTTRVLRIVPVEWKPSDASACLRLEALGCVVSPAVCETEGLLTNEEFLDSIISSPSISSAINFTINDLVTTRDAGWCTSGDLGSNPYLELNFTSLVSLTNMEVEGLRSTPGAYVSQFRLEVQDEFGNFGVYGITSEPTIFTASDPGLKLFTFWRPIQGNIFRLHIVKFRRNRDGFVCWNVKFYGCITNTIATEAIPGATSNITPLPPNEEITVRTSSNTTQEMNPGSSLGQSILPIVGVLGLVVLLTIVVTAIFIFTRRRRSVKVELSESCKGTSKHKLNNSMYGKEIVFPSPLYRDTTEHIFVNSIYGNGGEFTTDYCLAKPNLSLPLPPNAYESFVPSTTAAPIQHLNGTVVLNSETMHYDPVYAKCIAGELNTEYHHLTRPDIPSPLQPNAYESVVPSTIVVTVQNLNESVETYSEMMQYDPPYAKCNAGELNTGYHHLARPDISSSLPLNTSASVPSTTTEIYDEPICLNGTVERHDDGEMLYNPLYDKSNS